MWKNKNTEGGMKVPRGIRPPFYHPPSVCRVVGTLDPAGRRLLLIPRRPAPETLAPAAAVEGKPGAAGEGGRRPGGEAEAAEEASEREGERRAVGGRLERRWEVVGWGFVVGLGRRHHAARAPAPPTSAWGRTGPMLGAWAGWAVDGTRRDFHLPRPRLARRGAVSESLGSGPMERSR